MSIDSAKSFIERINTDAEFVNRALEQKGKEKFEEFLKVHGFDFSEEDFRQVIRCSESDGLSDAALDKVAGGWLWRHLLQYTGVKP